jgi:hypothetical protein
MAKADEAIPVIRSIEEHSTVISLRAEIEA